MNILKELPDLVSADIISQETADKIRGYYTSKENPSANRLVLAFSMLGAILVGLGIILIIAHNWDELSRTTKTIFAFLPLVVGQALSGFVLLKRPNNPAWRESAAAFLFFAIGASISLVSQIYHIPGSLSSFLLTWMLLCLPLVYILRSSSASLLYIAGITYYAVESGYWSYPTSLPLPYWLLLVALLPHYYSLYVKEPQSNFFSFHNWMIPLSLIICLGTLVESVPDLIFIAYFSLLGLFCLIGTLKVFKGQRLTNNGYLILGSLGTVGLLLGLSFDFYWKHLRMEVFNSGEVLTSPEFFAAGALSLLAGSLFHLQFKRRELEGAKPIASVFLLFIVIFTLGIFTSMAVVLINLLILIIGIWTVREGTKRDHLGILNFGLLIITVLAACRFFDTDLSFVLRGILFVSVGAGFFATNYWMLKKRKVHG